MKQSLSIICILSVALIFLSILSTHNKAPKEFGYEDLSEEDKIIVDIVLENYGQWKACSTSTKTGRCSNVTFFKENGEILFATGYNTSKTEEIGQNVSLMTEIMFKVFEIDISNRSLIRHSYTAQEFQHENAAMISATTGAKFKHGLSEIERRNVLENEYSIEMMHL